MLTGSTGTHCYLTSCYFLLFLCYVLIIIFSLLCSYTGSLFVYFVAFHVFCFCYFVIILLLHYYMVVTLLLLYYLGFICNCFVIWWLLCRFFIIWCLLWSILCCFCWVISIFRHFVDRHFVVCSYGVCFVFCLVGLFVVFLF